jgi:hypothetical protein
VAHELSIATINTPNNTESDAMIGFFICCLCYLFSQCLTINAIITANNKPSNEHTKLPLNSVIIATPNNVNDNTADNTKKILLNTFIRLKIKRATYKIASRPMIKLIFILP